MLPGASLNECPLAMRHCKLVSVGMLWGDFPWLQYCRENQDTGQDGTSSCFSMVLHRAAVLAKLDVALCHSPISQIKCKGK